MTRPKRDLGPRRVGFAFRTRPQTPTDVQVLGRLFWLQAVAWVEPAVLATLDSDLPLADWARQWHLTDAWCLEAAQRHRDRWRAFPDLPRVWLSLSAAYWVNPAAGPAPSWLKLGEHFEWLARFQVAGQSYLAIARAAGRDAGAVRSACRALAAQIGVTVRATPRGRPRS